MAFPTLTAAPVYPITENREDNTIKSSAESGYVLARPRFTRSRKNWGVSYRNVGSSDKSAIAGHYDAVGCSMIFSWTNPSDAAAYSVRYGKPPVITQRIPGAWDIELALEQV